MGFQLPAPTVDAFTLHMDSTNRHGTALRYRRAATMFLKFCSDVGCPQSELPENILFLFQQHLQQRGVGPSGTNTQVAGARRWLAWLKQCGHNVGKAAPNLAISGPRVPLSSPKIITPAKLALYLGVSSQAPEPFRSALLMLPFCGLRIIELVSLRVDDLQGIEYAGSRHLFVHVRDGKGGKQRDVLMLPDGQGLLMSYLTQWRDKVLLKNPYLFPSNHCASLEDTAHVSDRRIRQYTDEIGREIGCKISPHSLRRMYSTVLNQAGVPENIISKLLGHAPKTTAGKHYIDISPQDMVLAFEEHGARLMDPERDKKYEDIGREFEKLIRKDRA